MSKEEKCFGKPLLKSLTDVVERWKTRPHEFLSGTPKSQTDKIEKSVVSSGVQLHTSEVGAKQGEAEIRWKGGC